MRRFVRYGDPKDPSTHRYVEKIGNKLTNTVLTTEEKNRIEGTTSYTVERGPLPKGLVKPQLKAPAQRPATFDTQAVMRSNSPIRPRRQEGIDELQKHAELELNAKPKRPSQGSRKAGQKVDIKVDPIVRQEIEKGLLPWKDQTDSPEYFAGMTESQWDRKAKSAHNEILENPDYSAGTQDEVLRERFPNMDEADADMFIEHADSDRARKNWSRHHEYAVPHTVAKESQWERNFRLSGHDVEMLGKTSGDPTVTDMRLWLPDGSNQNWDMQDVMFGKSDGFKRPRINIGAIKRAKPGIVKEIIDRRGSGIKLKDLMSEIREKSYDPQLDKYLQDFGGERKKDYLVGNVMDQGKITNLLGENMQPKGTFNPTLGLGEYALDLNNTRDVIDNMTLSQINERIGGRVIQRGKSVGLSLDLQNIKRASGSEGLIEKVITPEVLQVIDEKAVRDGTRIPKGSGRQGGGNFPDLRQSDTRFHASFGIPDIKPKDVIQTIKRNAVGELTGGIVGLATNPELGRKLGAGDYKGAAVDAAVDIGTGAVVGGATQAAATALAPVGAAGTVMAAAAPFIAPAAVAASVPAMVDTAVAFRAGQQGRTLEQQKKVERTENVNQYREAMGGTAAGYRAVTPPKPKPQQRMASPQRVLAVLNGKEGYMLKGDSSSFRMSNWSDEQRKKYYGK